MVFGRGSLINNTSASLYEKRLPYFYYKKSAFLSLFLLFLSISWVSEAKDTRIQVINATLMFVFIFRFKTSFGV
jgi:hypothetical protein